MAVGRGAPWPASSSLRELSSQALTLLRGARFIVWRLRRPYLGECRLGPKAFLEPIGHFWATALCPDPPKKALCHTRPVGWTCDKYRLPTSSRTRQFQTDTSTCCTNTYFVYMCCLFNTLIPPTFFSSVSSFCPLTGYNANKPQGPREPVYWSSEVLALTVISRSRLLDAGAEGAQHLHLAAETDILLKPQRAVPLALTHSSGAWFIAYCVLFLGECRLGPRHFYAHQAGLGYRSAPGPIFKSLCIKYMIFKYIFVTFLLITLHTVKWFKEVLCITNNSIKHQSLVYTVKWSSYLFPLKKFVCTV